jgi:NADH dehydrogenase FAD-containing subunit
MSGDPKQILILGGGFAGVYTARYLEKLLRPEEASITLIIVKTIGSTSRCSRKSSRDPSV